MNYHTYSPATTAPPTTTKPADTCTVKKTKKKVTWKSPNYGKGDYPNNAMCDLDLKPVSVFEQNHF